MRSKPQQTPEYTALLALHPEYAHGEKMFRMYSGCSSSPVGYKNGVVEIEIRLSDAALEDELKTENVINGLIKKWMDAVPDAECYRAHIYKTGLAQDGFFTSGSKLKGKDGKPDPTAVKNLARTINHMFTAERIDIKIDEREWLSTTAKE